MYIINLVFNFKLELLHDMMRYVNDSSSVSKIFVNDYNKLVQL